VPLGNAKFDAFSRLSNHRGNLALLLRDVFEISLRFDGICALPPACARLPRELGATPREAGRFAVLYTGRDRGAGLRG
jgi:hypothetical protein